MVAREADQVLLFVDDEDEFGIRSLEQHDVLKDYGLHGDLIDAIRWFLQRSA